MPQHRRLHTEVERHNAPLSLRGDGVALAGRYRRHQIDAVGASLGAGSRKQVRIRRSTERARHRTRIAQDAREATSIDTGDTAKAETAQHVVERRLRPVIARSARHLAHDHAATEWSDRLAVEFVGAVVADVRIGEGDDLAGVARVGDHFLITRHDGVEHHLAACNP